jgi:hypothetical protein
LSCSPGYCRRENRRIRTFRYVPHHLVDDYQLLGWMMVDDLGGTPHGQWQVLMEWLCDCPLRESKGMR